MITSCFITQKGMPHPSKQDDRQPCGLPEPRSKWSRADKESIYVACKSHKQLVCIFVLHPSFLSSRPAPLAKWVRVGLYRPHGLVRVSSADPLAVAIAGDSSARTANKQFATILAETWPHGAMPENG